jgi:hypothetical protein
MLVPEVNAYTSLGKTNFFASTIMLTTPGAIVFNTSFRMVWIVWSTNVELWVLRYMFGPVERMPSKIRFWDRLAVEILVNTLDERLQNVLAKQQLKHLGKEEGKQLIVPVDDQDIVPAGKWTDIGSNLSCSLIAGELMESVFLSCAFILLLNDFPGCNMSAIDSICCSPLQLPLPGLNGARAIAEPCSWDCAIFPSPLQAICSPPRAAVVSLQLWWLNLEPFRQPINQVLAQYAERVEISKNWFEVIEIRPLDPAGWEAEHLKSSTISSPLTEHTISPPSASSFARALGRMHSFSFSAVIRSVILIFVLRRSRRSY